MQGVTHFPGSPHIAIVGRGDSKVSGSRRMTAETSAKIVEMLLGRFSFSVHGVDASRISTNSQGRNSKFSDSRLLTNLESMSCATSNDFERYFVEEVVRLHTERGMSFSDFARAAWPKDENCVNRWRRIRNHGQGLSISDMHTIACVLGYTAASLVFEVSESYRRALGEKEVA